MAYRLVTAAALPEPAPQINTTPLIDVMLVLLIMFILSVPIQMHSTSVDLPGKGVATAPTETHRIAIDVFNTPYWDGQPVSEAVLATRLRAVAARPDVALEIKPDALARYEVVDRIIASAQIAGVRKIGFVGNEVYAR